MKIVQTLVLVMITTFALTACNTVKGFGKDIEGAGEAIQRSTK